MARRPTAAANRTGVAPSTPDDPLNQPFTEFGATGLRQYSGYVREEWLKDLIGWKGIRMLREMRDNDPIIGAIFFAIEMLLRSVVFRVEPVDSKNPDDIAAADFVTSCMADIEQAWPSLLADVLSFLQYGWAVHEIVYKMRSGSTSDPKTDSAYDDGMIGWRKFAPRSQETLLHWEFDEAGDATAMIQLLPTGGPLLRVPLAKCVHFLTVPTKMNPEGRSILRNSYTSYYFKKRIQEIEAIGIERDLAGVPIAWVPPKIMNQDATAADKAQFETWKSIARDVSRNNQEGFVLPLAYDKDKNKIFDFTLLSSGGKRQFDTSAVISRYDHSITATVLADFIVLGGSGSQGRGSFAQSKNKTDLFGIAVVGFLDLIAAEFNRKAIPDLLKINTLDGACRMTHGDVSRVDLEELGQFIFQTAQAGALIPDANLENHLRAEAGLPMAAGEAGDDLNTGGPADEDSDTGDTNADKPGEEQGGSAGSADDGSYDPTPTGGRRTRKRR